MRNPLAPSQTFEDVVRRILEARNFAIRPHAPRGDAGFDFDGRFEGETWAIEVKYYRTARAQPTLLDAAAFRVASNGKAKGVSNGMLVVSCLLSAAVRDALEKRFGIAIIDRVDLRNWAAATPGLVDELDAIVEAYPESSPDVQDRRLDISSKRGLLQGFVQPLKMMQGATLCDELRATKRGKGDWVAYEDLCARILKYLFANDLYGWHKQKRTDDGLNRFDFVCRVRPTTEFWRFLIDHLSSRYVLFEFKNYRASVKQGQILTTEKYLIERGLRRVALILTRAGAAQDALRMTQGAMREHGKLMLVIDDKTVCDMLHMKDRGEDPSDCLFDLADDFLLKLPR